MSITWKAFFIPLGFVSLNVYFSGIRRSTAEDAIIPHYGGHPAIYGERWATRTGEKNQNICLEAVPVSLSKPNGLSRA